MELVRHRQTKGSATDRLHLNHRVTPRLHMCGIVFCYVPQGAWGEHDRVVPSAGTLSDSCSLSERCHSGSRAAAVSGLSSMSSKLMHRRIAWVSRVTRLVC